MYFISDWAILNDTKSKQLQRILVTFHHLSAAEIQLACILLESYHAVYRRNRLEQRRNLLKLGQAKIQAGCLPPTAMQLYEIAQRVNTKATLNLQAEDVLTHLQDLAKRLRQYRIYVRKDLRETASLNGKHNLSIGDRLRLPDFTNYWEIYHKPTELLVLNYTNITQPRYEFTQSRKNGRCCGR